MKKYNPELPDVADIDEYIAEHNYYVGIDDMLDEYGYPLKVKPASNEEVF